MDHISIGIIVFLMAFGFIASFIDSVVGGGGLISIPALLFVGLPPSAAIATNKLAATMGSLTSTVYFICQKKVDIKIIKRLLPFTIVGAMIGAFVLKYISSEILRPLVLILLILVALYTFLKKDWGTVSTYKGLTKGKSILFLGVILLIGFYDGFFGPGTGSFLIFAFLTIGFDFISAAANGRILNFASNITALLAFIFLGAIHYEYGIVMGVSMIIGAYTGTKFAMKKGVGYVRILFLVVTVLLIGKNVVDYFHLM